MITVCSLFWEANGKSLPFSRMYDEVWVERLFRGFARNLTEPFQFVLFTDRCREYEEPIKQVVMPTLGAGGYGDCVLPYSLNLPMILVGLDTVIAGNIDHLARYCMTGQTLMLPRDPFRPQIACNGVALVPAGMENVANTNNGENDMDWVRSFPHLYIDDKWPGQVVSYKGHVKAKGLGDARIVYFHGLEKPHQIDETWLKTHWA